MQQIHERVAVLENRVCTLENEHEATRRFKHSTNNELHAQNGKIEVIMVNQNHTAEAIKALTETLQAAMLKVGKLMSLRFMLIGGASAASVMVLGAYYILDLYLQYGHK
jgi:chaperonin cofactor prefoldin